MTDSGRDLTFNGPGFSLHLGVVDLQQAEGPGLHLRRRCAPSPSSSRGKADV